MKNLSIKQLLILLLVGVVLMGGAEYYAFSQSDYSRMDTTRNFDEESLEAWVESGKITEDEKEWLLENNHFDGGHRSNSKRKFR